jgi:hypothetical protein
MGTIRTTYADIFIGKLIPIIGVISLIGLGVYSRIDRVTQEYEIGTLYTYTYFDGEIINIEFDQLDFSTSDSIAKFRRLQGEALIAKYNKIKNFK